MFKIFNTKTLLIIIVILGGIALFNKFYLNKKEESTFRDEFVRIDSGAVSSIYIYPQVEKGKEIRIIKNGQHWDLQNDKIKTIADSNAVRSLLRQFADMKSLSLAGEDKSSWKDLQVNDSSGTRIKIMTSDNQAYNMIVGKFGYNPSNGSGLTYIRHADEDAVYSVQGYLSFSINQPFNSWRNKTVINGNKDNWTTLTFTYPGDSSFVLTKSNNEWMINGEKADSAKTIRYLNQLASMQSTGFADGYSPASTPVYNLSIAGNNLSAPIIVQAYPADTAQKFILHSSLNPDAYFSESQSHLIQRLFVGRGNFID